MTAIALSFNNTQFDIIDRNNQPWLRSFQIGSALGYKNPSSDMSKLFDRNADEFTDTMTALVELDTEGGKQQVRVFSLRGCHLLAMLSRTKVAKEFRKWVLDILDNQQTQQLPDPKTKKALPGGLTLEQQDTIKALVKANAEVLPKEKQAGAVIKQWAAIKQKFGCTYKEVSPDNFVNILSLLSRLPIEGELLPAPSVNNDLVEILTKRIKTLEGELMPKEPEQIPKLTGKCYIKTKIHLDADHLAEMMQEQGLMLVDAKEYTVVRRQEAGKAY